MAGKKNIWKVGELVRPTAPMKKYTYQNWTHYVNPSQQYKVTKVNVAGIHALEVGGDNSDYTIVFEAHEIERETVAAEACCKPEAKSQGKSVVLTTADRPSIVREAANKGKREGFLGVFGLLVSFAALAFTLSTIYLGGNEMSGAQWSVLPFGIGCAAMIAFTIYLFMLSITTLVGED